jgi:hypothetical protein
MKKYSRFITEEGEDRPKKPVVFAFGRMNPPTTGHKVLVDKVHDLAKKHNAAHHVVLSRSVDPKKNPLNNEQKLKHAKRFFPHSNISIADKDHPTLLHHASKLNKEGHDHLIVVAGQDRVKEYHDLLHKYNGKANQSGEIPYSYKKIHVVSAGARDPDAEGSEGMSASKMRAHAASNSFDEFKKGIPDHVHPDHAREMFDDVRNSMKAKENVKKSKK